MKLLIITQKMDINDDLLGFMHSWVIEFAKNCERLTVICLKKGEFDLPQNVKVLSLGKEEGRSRLKYIWRFYGYILQERKNYDAIFVHMNPEYIILGGLFWRLWGKRISLWYAHGHVPLMLKIAEKISHIIFTSTKGGCRLSSHKIKIVGQGIDVEKFAPAPSRPHGLFKIVTVGRISPTKDLATLIDAGEILKNEKKINFQINIIGGIGMSSDQEFIDRLKKIVENKNLSAVMEFAGPIANKKVVNFLQSADLFVNMSHTGSLDKAILEAMACGLPVLSCNESLPEVLGPHQDMLVFPKKDFKQLADKIKAIYDLSDKERLKLGNKLREIVVRNHSLVNFVNNILKETKIDNKN
jgi:glycosyltransferase involved in cell wall biosynthesis